jgi:hypothetical protein
VPKSAQKKWCARLFSPIFLKLGVKMQCARHSSIQSWRISRSGVESAEKLRLEVIAGTTPRPFPRSGVESAEKLLLEVIAETTPDHLRKKNADLVLEMLKNPAGCGVELAEKLLLEVIAETIYFPRFGVESAEKLRLEVIAETIHENLRKRNA